MALVNAAVAAEPIVQDVETPSDEVANAIIELEAEANDSLKAAAKKPAPAK